MLDGFKSFAKHFFAFFNFMAGKTNGPTPAKISNTTLFSLNRLIIKSCTLDNRLFQNT